MSIGDDDAAISGDAAEWILGDEKVASKWKEIAARLHLESYIPIIDRNYTFKRKKFDKHKLKELLDVWKRNYHKTYTNGNLLRVLSQVGCSDMVNWLLLLRTDCSPRKNEIACMIDRSRSNTPISYSPYSWYFGSNGGGSVNNEDRPESSRSFNSEDRDSPPSRPLSAVSSSSSSNMETVRKTTTMTTTTRTFERRFFEPKPKIDILRPVHERDYLYSDRETVLPSANSKVNNIKKSHSLVNPAPFPTTTSFKPQKAVSFKETLREEYENKESPCKELPKGISVEKYFDNLISMIQDAADDLKV